MYVLFIILAPESVNMRSVRLLQPTCYLPVVLCRVQMDLGLRYQLNLVKYTYMILSPTP